MVVEEKEAETTEVEETKDDRTAEQIHKDNVLAEMEKIQTDIDESSKPDKPENKPKADDAPPTDESAKDDPKPPAEPKADKDDGSTDSPQKLEWSEKQIRTAKIIGLTETDLADKDPVSDWKWIKETSANVSRKMSEIGRQKPPETDALSEEEEPPEGDPLNIDYDSEEYDYMEEGTRKALKAMQTRMRVQDEQREQDRADVQERQTKTREQAVEKLFASESFKHMDRFDPGKPTEDMEKGSVASILRNNLIREVHALAEYHEQAGTDVDVEILVEQALTRVCPEDLKAAREKQAELEVAEHNKKTTARATNKRKLKPVKTVKDEVFAAMDEVEKAYDRQIVPK